MIYISLHMHILLLSRYNTKLQTKRFATSARSFDIWIIENKLGGQLILHKVHFRAKKWQLRFFVN